MKKYISPDFYVIIYDIEDAITLSIGDGDPNGGDGSDWWG